MDGAEDGCSRSGDTGGRQRSGMRDPARWSSSMEAATVSCGNRGRERAGEERKENGKGERGRRGRHWPAVEVVAGGEAPVADECREAATRAERGGRGSPCGNGAARGRSIRAMAAERLGPNGLPRARSGSWRAWRWWEVGRDAWHARVGGGRGQVAAGLMEARQVVAEDLASAENEAEVGGGGG